MNSFFSLSLLNEIISQILLMGAIGTGCFLCRRHFKGVLENISQHHNEESLEKYFGEDFLLVMIVIFLVCVLTAKFIGINFLASVLFSIAASVGVP